MNWINIIIIKKKYFINFNFYIGNVLTLDILNEKLKLKKFLGIFFYKNFKNFNLNFKLFKNLNGFFLKKTIYIFSKNFIKLKLNNKKKDINFYRKFSKFLKS